MLLPAWLFIQAMLDVRESVATDLSEYYPPNSSEVEAYVQAQQTIATKIFRDFVSLYLCSIGDKHLRQSYLLYWALVNM